MGYSVTRWEPQQSAEGTTTEIFTCFQIINDLGLFNFGYWLTPQEVADYIGDNTKKDAIIEAAYIKGLAAQKTLASFLPATLPDLPE